MSDLRNVGVTFEAFSRPAGLDTAVSHALLIAASEGRIGSILRLYRPERIVAFGRRDTTAPRYREAVAVARSRGFGTVERLAGGRAAVFHPGTLAFSWTVPDRSPRATITARFQVVAQILLDALHALGAADVHIGEIPGEYCPGAYSLNIAKRYKIAGIGQRLLRNAAHVGGVVVVSDATPIRDVLTPIYDLLDIDWDPATTGDLASALPGMAVETVRSRIVDAFAQRYDVREVAITPSIVEKARSLAIRHIPE